jgi:hypothetical protein
LFDAPHSVDVDAAGNVVVGDPLNDRIRKIDVQTGMVTTIAGIGGGGYGGDGGPATQARLHDCKIAIVGPDDAIYVADMGNFRIRRIDPVTGTIDTWAGNGVNADTGDGGDARQASVRPRNIAFAPDNDLIVADRAGQRVRRIDWETRIITPFAGRGIVGPGGDGGPALEAELNEVRGLGADWMGNVYLADSLNHRVRRVDAETGIITTVAGSTESQPGRKDGPVDEALLTNPRHAIFDDAGNLFITDTGTSRIRKIANYIPPRPAPAPAPAPAPQAPNQPAVPVQPNQVPDGPAAQPTASRSGYWMLGTDGRVYSFGHAESHGDAPATAGRSVEAADLEPTVSGQGYWVVDSAGRVSTHGDAFALGNVEPGRLVAGETVTSLSATPSGRGYWIFTTKGRTLAFGDARHFGDLAAQKLNGPVLDSIPTPSGQGYYMVASDGGIFAFGDARFFGSMGGKTLNAPVQSLVPDVDGVGYWLVAADGGVFSFDAPFRGSLGGTKLNKPITGMVPFGNGYLMVGQDGGIFNFSDRPFSGSLGDHPPSAPIVAVAALAIG